MANKKHKIPPPGKMKQAPCSPANSVLEGDLQLAVKHQIIKSLTVVEVPTGFSVVIEFSGKPDTLKQHRQAGLPDWFHILVQLLATPGKQWYLTTRRNRTSPRIFKDLSRLNDYLRQTCPDSGFTLVRTQQTAKAQKPPTTRKRNTKI